MQSILLIGDHETALGQLATYLDTEFEVRGINFIDTDVPDYSFVEDGIWKTVDIRDFHQLTIDAMDIEPNIIVFLSSFNHLSKANKSPELTNLATAECILHILEISEIFNPFIVVLEPHDMRIEESQALQDSYSETRQYLVEHGRNLVIKYLPLAGESTRGFWAWYCTSGFPRIRSGWTSITDLGELLKNAIKNRHLGKRYTKHTEEPESKISDYNGEVIDFSYLIKK